MKRLTILLAVILMLSGCRRGLPRPAAPRPRAVSFSPAITEMLFEMGLGDHVVGVTTYCRPPEGEGIPVVGSQLNVRAEPILAVEPDVVLTQTEPGRFETVRKLKQDIRIEFFQIETLADIGDAMVRMADILGEPDKGRRAREQFDARLDEVRRRVAGRVRPRVIFVMGHHDPSTAGRATFMNELIVTAGGINPAAEKYEGWKSISIESLLKLAPDVIVCESDKSAADAARKYWEELAVAAGRKVRVHVVTDHRWTIPTGLTADPFAARLADFIHPETAGGDAK